MDDGTQRYRVNVLGIDLSSRAIDLVLLDENRDRAEWTRITLEGASAFDRAREIHDLMPQPDWYHDHGVYLIAIERPFVRAGQDVIRLVQGCVLASLPRDLPCWEVTVGQWKAALGVPIREKPTWEHFPPFELDAQNGGRWTPGTPLAQDALDAFGVALYARNLNHQAITEALAQ